MKIEQRIKNRRQKDNMYESPPERKHKVLATNDIDN